MDKEGMMLQVSLMCWGYIKVEGGAVLCYAVHCSEAQSCVLGVHRVVVQYEGGRGGPSEVGGGHAHHEL